MTTAPRNIHIVSNTGINRGTSGRFLKQDDAAAGGPHVHVRNNLYIAPSLDTSDADTEMIAVNHMDDFAEIDDNVWSATSTPSSPGNAFAVGSTEMNLPDGTRRRRTAVMSSRRWKSTRRRRRRHRSARRVRTRTSPRAPTGPAMTATGFCGRQRAQPRGAVQRSLQSPYRGSAFAIGSTPVTIEAEDYVLGGDNVAYHDTDTVNDGANTARTAWTS